MPTSVARKAPSCALSTTAPMSLWGPRAAAAVSSWLPTWRPRKRAASGAPARAWSTNSFSPICRKRGSPPPMWWPSTCIVARVPRCLPMKMTNRTPIAGAVMHRLDKKPGKSSVNGSGTCAWNWAISLSPLRCAPPRLLLPSPLSHRTRLLPRAMLPLRWACAGRADRFSGQDFPLQPDGTLRCPAGQELRAHEQRREVDGSLRVVYAASLRSCRPCPLREQCQWQGSATKKPRQVSVLLHPLVVGSEPIRWRDWSRRAHRLACIQLVRHQCVKVEVEPPTSASLPVKPAPLSRAQRAHYRLSWAERLARNARLLTAERVTIKLFGVPQA